jgi:hypothetical protein
MELLTRPPPPPPQRLGVHNKAPRNAAAPRATTRFWGHDTYLFCKLTWEPSASEKESSIVSPDITENDSKKPLEINGMKRRNNMLPGLPI